jgi:pimeloyl-ACP methyl ester carboxylesterase
MSKRTVALVGILSLVAACGGGSTPSIVGPLQTIGATPAPTAEAPSPTPAPTVPPTRFDGKVALADGGFLLARCTGTGSPTILLEAGGTEGNMQEWGSTFPLTLALHATVCRYSHRGGEGSSDAPNPLTWATVLGDADALLDAVREQAGIDGPYVFVGWSFGGEVALGEAVAHRTETKGLVILDTDFPRDFMTQCLGAGHSRTDCQAEFDSDHDAKAIEVDLVKSIVPMPEIPLLLISALRPGPDCTVEPGSSVSYGMGGQEITAPDCETLFAKIADFDLTEWGTIGTVRQTRVDADHDGLIRSAGPQIANLILGLIGAPS